MFANFRWLLCQYYNFLLNQGTRYRFQMQTEQLEECSFNNKHAESKNLKCKNFCGRLVLLLWQALDNTHFLYGLDICKYFELPLWLGERVLPL